MNLTETPWKEALDHLEKSLRAAYQRIAELEAGPEALPTDDALATELYVCMERGKFFINAPALIARHRDAHTAALQAKLAKCYRLTGADTSGGVKGEQNEDWRLAEYAVQEVESFRKEYDDLQTTVVSLEEKLRIVVEALRGCRGELYALYGVHSKTIHKVDVVLQQIAALKDASVKEGV